MRVTLLSLGKIYLWVSVICSTLYMWSQDELSLKSTVLTRCCVILFFFFFFCQHSRAEYRRFWSHSELYSKTVWKKGITTAHSWTVKLFNPEFSEDSQRMSIGVNGNEKTCYIKPVLVMYTCNPSTLEAEAEAEKLPMNLMFLQSR